MTIERGEIQRIAQTEFDYSRLRPGQEQAIRALAEGRDVLAVMPTGAGKSAIYQIAAQLREGPAAIISPLLALQRDQAESIAVQEVGEASLLNSDLSASERTATLGALRDRAIDFIFLAPEQLAHDEVIDALRAAQLALVAVDEAHCVSQWGHDFRPDYLRLGAALAALGHPPIVALTATAAPPVRSEIIERLELRDPVIVIKGFDRPNIHLAVETFHSSVEKQRAIIERIKDAPKPGIAYVATRKHAEELAQALEQVGIRTAAYHAGMKATEREAVQATFMDDTLEVIVATIAFGMGIDKPNVRFVYHYDISESLDAYYQEIGRAGRDGEPAEAILFYRPEDVATRRFQAHSGNIEPDLVARLIDLLQARHQPRAIADLHDALAVSAGKVQTIINYLSDLGAVAITDGGLIIPANNLNRADLAEAVSARQTQHNEFERSRVEMMQGYAETNGCRREFLLNYFGDTYTPPCASCDNCDAGRTEHTELAVAGPFPLNTRVQHQSLGEGTVMRYDGDSMVVLFDEHGYQQLLTAMVIDAGMMTPAPEAGA